MCISTVIPAIRDFRWMVFNTPTEAVSECIH